MAKRPSRTNSTDALIARAKSLPATGSGVTSSSSSVVNTGEMSTSTQHTGATGGQVNTTVIRTQGDPGFPAGQESDVIKAYRAFFGL